MALHPTGTTPHLALISGVAHGLALLSVLLMLLGALGLTLMLNAPDRLAITALVTYGFASVAIMVAASVSGFIMPDLIRMMGRDMPAVASQWRIVIASIFRFNQAFSKLYSVAGAIAIGLWSLSCLRSGRSRFIAIYGCVSAPVIALLILVGHLRLDIHGMTVVMLSQVVWFVGAGMWLRQQDGR